MKNKPKGTKVNDDAERRQNWRQIVKWFVVCVNGAWLIATVFSFTRPDFKTDVAGALILIGVVLTLLLNIGFAFFYKTSGWLGLYFRRKAAEERKRIAELEQEMQKDSK